MFKEDGRPISDKLEIANKFNLYFTKIGSNLSEKIVIPQNKNFRDYMKKTQTTHFTFSEIKNITVEKVIDKFKNKSSNGWNGMECKVAKVIPLYKKDDEIFFSNYRPISLLPAISNIFGKVIFIQLFTYLIVNNF